MDRNSTGNDRSFTIAAYDDARDRISQERAKQAARRSPQEPPAPSVVSADDISDGRSTVTLHLPEPINAALQGSYGTFRRFVQDWDFRSKELVAQEPVSAMMEGLSLCGPATPLALRHSISTPSIPTTSHISAGLSAQTSQLLQTHGTGVPSQTLDPSSASPPPTQSFSLDPFQRSTSSPASNYNSFGTSRSAFTLLQNTFVKHRTRALERRHSVSAFGPVQFYSLALQDAEEQTAIEVEPHPETTAANFLSSGVRILRRRRRPGGRENPMAVTVLEHPEDPIRDNVAILQLPHEDSPNDISGESGISDLSGIAPGDDDGFDSESSEVKMLLPRSQQLGAEATSSLEHHTSLTGSSSCGLPPMGLSTISETDQEVAEANGRIRYSDASERQVYVVSSPIREGATLPVERFLHQPLVRLPTTSTTSSQNTGTTATYRSNSGLASVSVGGSTSPQFVSYDNDDGAQGSPCCGLEEEKHNASPAASCTESSTDEVLVMLESQQQQRSLRIRYVSPTRPSREQQQQPSIEITRDEYTKVTAISDNNGEIVTVVTPEKEESSLKKSSDVLLPSFL